MGKTRIQEMTRAQALREILALKEETAFLQKQCMETPGLKVTWDALEELKEFRKHKNYHVRIAAWKAQGAPMPKGKDHDETIELTIKLAQDLQPNQVARYFAQQDEELAETLTNVQSNSVDKNGDAERAKKFSNVMKQQYCVSLLERISGQGMVV